MVRSILSTADDRRPDIVAAGIRAFARTGYHGTTVADVAREAGISPAYVLKLYSSKEAVFIAAVEEGFRRITQALETGIDRATEQHPDGILDAMGLAYAELISDRSLLMLQVHAQSASDVPQVGAALRRGYADVTELAASRSGASPEAVQRFIAFGQLCHLIVTLGIDDTGSGWEHVLAAGIRHPDPGADAPS